MDRPHFAEALSKGDVTAALSSSIYSQQTDGGHSPSGRSGTVPHFWLN